MLLGNAAGEAFMRNMTTMTAKSLYVNGCSKDDSPVCKDWMGGGATVAFVSEAVNTFIHSVGLK